MHRVTLIPGDGIGPEVIGAACRVVEATGVAITWDRHEVGMPAIEQGLEPLPASVLTSMRTNGVGLKGPVSTPIGRHGFRSVNVELRRALDLYAQARPCQSLPGALAPFDGVDLVVIRETTEDLYAGVELEAGSAGAEAVIEIAHGCGSAAVPSGAGLSIKFVTEAASRRVLEFAVEYARNHFRKHITVVHKATVMRCTDGIFLGVARDVAAITPDLEFEEQQIDNLCGALVRRPEDFDVLVMGIQYGDIVSDLGAGLVGGIGLVPSANVGDAARMFEPAHGTAPSHAGKGEANPTAAVRCGAMLLEHLGELAAAHRVEAAVRSVIARGSRVTYDLCRGRATTPATTDQMADAIIAALEPA